MNDSPAPSPTNTENLLDWDQDKQPVSRKFGDIYFSKENGLKESRYVFIQHNRLLDRWRKLQQNESFFIAETGFGTGLNFLATWQAWNTLFPNPSVSPRLVFYSVEKYPIKKQDLIKALSLWPELKTFSEKLIDAWPPHFIPGVHKLNFPKVSLCLYFGEIVEGLNHLQTNANCSSQVKQKHISLGQANPEVQAWYLDGFAPSKNPEMWRPQVFECMAHLSGANTTFATFTCAGDVRRALEKHQFSWRKTAGYGRKREMLSGEFLARDQSQALPNEGKKLKTVSSCWQLLEYEHEPVKPITATVVGAGLAGCHTAFALASRGIQVSLVEKASKIASGASANQRGILYTRLSPEKNSLVEFNLKAQLFANQFYQTHGIFTKAGKQSGVFHMEHSSKSQRHYAELKERFTDYQNEFRYCSKQEASELAGIETQAGGLFLPKAGWLNPAKVCDALLQHPNITLHCNSEINEINQYGKNWELQSTKGQLFASEIVVLANAHDISRFPQSRFLPIKSIRGQVTYIKSLPENLKQLKIAICAEGYAAPWSDGGICLGASFNLNNSAPQIDPMDHKDNIARFQAICPDYARTLSQINIAELEGRVGFRCTTPDYFPITGPVPIVSEMAKRFALLSRNANSQIAESGAYYQGLYCLTGLGSRGLAYAPLAADALASTIVGESLPLTQPQWLRIHPARFIIKNLIRNRPIPGLH